METDEGMHLFIIGNHIQLIISFLDIRNARTYFYLKPKPYVLTNFAAKNADLLNCMFYRLWVDSNAMDLIKYGEHFAFSTY